MGLMQIKYYIILYADPILFISIGAAFGATVSSYYYQSYLNRLKVKYNITNRQEDKNK